MEVKTKTFSMFDGKANVTVVVGGTGDWFETGPGSPPYKEMRIKQHYAGCAFVSKPPKGVLGAHYPHIVFNADSARDEAIDEDTVIHECFHMFFMLLNMFKQTPRSMLDIATDEIYARAFTYLVDNVKQISTELLAEYRTDKKASIKMALQKEKTDA